MNTQVRVVCGLYGKGVTRRPRQGLPRRMIRKQFPAAAPDPYACPTFATAADAPFTTSRPKPAFADSFSTTTKTINRYVHLPTTQRSLYGQLPSIIIQTPAQRSSGHRRADVTPKTDEQKLVAGQADVSPTVIESLQDSSDPPTAAWKSSVSSSPDIIVAGIPPAALQWQLSDSVTQDQTRTQIDPAIASTLKADSVARQQAVIKASLLYFNGQRPAEKLQKKLLATILCVRAELSPDEPLCNHANR